VIAFSLIDRHLGRSVAIGTALVLGVFTALFAFIVLVDVLPDYGKNGFNTYELIRFVVLSQPRKLYEIFPVAVLIGTLLGLSTLALNSELIAMRAAGVSRLQIIGATMKTGAILVFAAMLAGEYVVPVAETRAQTTRAEALASGLQKGEAGLWLRDGPSFINIGEVLPDSSLLNVNIYELTPEYELSRHTYAGRANFEDGQWTLSQVASSRVGTERVQTQIQPAMAWTPALTPDVVALFTIRPEALSIMQLYSYIRHLERNNLDATRYVLAFWQKCFMPLATALMMFLAVPFVFRSVRGGGLAQRVFIGIVIGLAFVVIHRAVGHFAVIYGVSPFVAALSPLILFFVLAAWMTQRQA
jgi:lipopolysaccharide export system permease protein